MKRQRLVIKIGTNVLQRANGKLDYNVISELSAEVSSIRDRGHEVLLVSSGAIGAGREMCSVDEEENPLIQHQILASVGQARLMQIYTDFMREHHITVAQVLLTRMDFGNRSSYLNIRNTLLHLLQAGILPIVNENDVVATEELELNFGDNDWLAVYVAALVGADQLFYLTIAPGLIRQEESRKENKTVVIESISELNKEVLQHCLPATSESGKGGMESKARAAGLAMSFGIHAYILDGKAPGGVKEILSGKKIGTHFIAQGKKIRSYQKWLAAGALSQGQMFIDEGAEDALLNHKRSLLSRGICRVKGQFESKELVEICNSDGVRLGVGRTRLSAQELRKLLAEQKKDHTASPERNHKPIIHRDHLFLE